MRQHNHSEGKSGGKHGNSRTEKARRLASEAAEDDVKICEHLLFVADLPIPI